MSNIYIQEPPTEGKVCLETTAGDIDIELWSREAPKACRNFIQLCMEGYYDGTMFHRLVKGFIVQGGDPTGTGMGGNSIWGKPFKDEFHSRLRFVRRGLVAMANAGRDDNGSQFFFTLGPTPELQNKHTVFGKVGGNTIYNMLKLEDGMTDENEKPLYPHKILKTRILSNPYSDIVPRESIKRVKDDKKEKKSKAAATKNYKLLSFGSEAEEDEEEVATVNKKFSGKSKSSHDLTSDPKLSSTPAVEPSTSSRSQKKTKSRHSSSSSSGSISEHEDNPEKDHHDSGEDRLGREKEMQSIRDKLKAKGKDKHKKSDSKSKPEPAEDPYYLGKDLALEQQQKLENLRKEFKDLKRSMKKETQAKQSEAEKASKEAEEKASKLAKDNSVIKAYIDEQERYKSVKAKAPKKGEDREAMTLALLAKFKSKIETAKESFSEKDLRKKDEEEGDKDEPEVAKENPEDDSWLARKLHYDDAKDEVLAKDANRKGDDWFDIYDPRNALTKRRRERGRDDTKEKKRARINN